MQNKKYLLCKPADWHQANNICFCIFIRVECVTYRKNSSTGVTKDLARVASLPRSDCRSWCDFYCQWLPLQRLQETHRSLRTTPCLVIKSSWLLHSYTMWKFSFYILLLKCVTQLPMNWQTYCSYLTLHCITFYTSLQSPWKSKNCDADEQMTMLILYIQFCKLKLAAKCSKCWDMTNIVMPPVYQIMHTIGAN